MRPTFTSDEVLPVTAAPKRRSNAQRARDLRRQARRNAEQQADVRASRVDTSARTRTVNEFAADTLDRRQRDLDAEKLRLRGDARDGLGTSEAASFNGTISMRGTR